MARVLRDRWKIQAGEWLRMMVQARAGTGKSFLLSTVYLWCLVHGHRVKGAAPTGIAAANIETVDGIKSDPTSDCALWRLR